MVQSIDELRQAIDELRQKVEELTETVGNSGKKASSKRAVRTWMPDEDDDLLQSFSCGRSWKSIGRILLRSETECRMRIGVLLRKYAEEETTEKLSQRLHRYEEEIKQLLQETERHNE